MPYPRKRLHSNEETPREASLGPLHSRQRRSLPGASSQEALFPFGPKTACCDSSLSTRVPRIATRH